MKDVGEKIKEVKRAIASKKKAGGDETKAKHFI